MVVFRNAVVAMAAAVMSGAGVMGAQLTKVTYPNNATSRAEMYIYVPDKVVASPPLVVVIRMYSSFIESCIATAVTPGADVRRAVH